MSMTVKKLIDELSKIENQFLEVKVISTDLKMMDVKDVRRTNFKFILITTKD